MITLNIETIKFRVNGVDIILEYMEEKLRKNEISFSLYKSTNLLFTNYYLIEYSVSLNNYISVNLVYNIDYNNYILFLTPNSEVKFEQMVKDAYYATLIIETKDTYKGKFYGQTNKSFTIQNN